MSARYRNLDEMPEGMRRLYLAQIGPHDKTDAKKSGAATGAARTIPDRIARASRPEPEPRAHDPSGRTAAAEAYYTGRVLVRVTAHHCGVATDPDNLFAKPFVDLLRYAGIIADDSPEFIDFEVRQRRVLRKKEERVEIEVIPIEEAIAPVLQP